MNGREGFCQIKLFVFYFIEFSGTLTRDTPWYMWTVCLQIFSNNRRVFVWQLEVQHFASFYISLEYIFEMSYSTVTRQPAKNQVSTNQNSRIRWCLIVRLIYDRKGHSVMSSFYLNMGSFHSVMGSLNMIFVFDYVLI